MDDFSPVAYCPKNPSFIDYPGKISGLFFTSGCNFRCGFCHNSKLIDSSKIGISWERIDALCLRFLEEWVDGVVITGGEPTIHQSLPQLIDIFCKHKFSIKLDTNGSSPDMLLKVIDKVDYIAMDIKCSLDNYEKLTGYNDSKNIIKSIEIIKDKAKDYEFRTTVIEKIHTEEEMSKIAKMVNGCKTYAMQRFLPKEDLPDISLRNTEFRTSEEHIEKIKPIFSFVQKLIVR